MVIRIFINGRFFIETARDSGEYLVLFMVLGFVFYLRSSFMMLFCLFLIVIMRSVCLVLFVRCVFCGLFVSVMSSVVVSFVIVATLSSCNLFLYRLVDFWLSVCIKLV